MEVMTTNDRQIIELLFQRDETALSELTRQYGRSCTRLAKQILGSDEDAQEVWNDALLAIWNAIPPAQPESLPAYIAKLARNTACRRLEYMTAAKRNPEVLLSLDELGDCIGETPANRSDAELRETINGFLETLKPAHRRVFLLRYWQFLSVTEVAAQMGYSKSKTEAILHRTRNKLRQYLEERGYAV